MLLIIKLISNIKLMHNTKYTPKKYYSNIICSVVDDATSWAFSTLWSSITFWAFRYGTYYTLRALTVLSALQWSSACQGPCGRLCVSGLPGSDQARRDNPGYVWMGSSCCQPAVQELQDPGPHHWHWIPSVHWLLLSFLFLSFPTFSLDLLDTHLC